MVDQTKLQELIGGIYDAALEPEQWPKLLERMTNAFRGIDTIIHGMDFENRRQTFCFMHGLDDSNIREYNAHDGYWMMNDPRAWVGRTMPVGGILHEPMFITEQEMKRHEYYTEFISRFDGWWSIGGSLANSRKMLAAVTVHRALRFGAFDEKEIEAFGIIVPHLQRAMLMQQRFETLTHERDMRQAVFEKLSHPIIIVDADCRVRLMNMAARRLTDSFAGRSAAAV
jgi:hypothetical protein